MKQVWIVNHYAQSPNNFGGTRHYSLAKYLISYGWQASIIASSLELNSARQLINPNEAFRYEETEGVGFLRIRTNTYKENGLSRILNMAIFSIKVCISKYTQCLPKPDVIVGSTVHPFAALAGYVLSKKYKVPFVFEVRDLWPQTLIDMGHLKENSIITNILRRLEHFLAKKSVAIISLLPKAADYFKGKGISSEKIIWIPNGIDFSDFTPQRIPKKQKNNFILLYFGAHGKANGLDNLIIAMTMLKNNSMADKIKLQLVGDGPEKQQLIQKTKDFNIENRIEFLNPIQKKDIAALCETANAFIFNLVNIPVFKYGISSNKLFDFMAGGKPIIFCCDAANNPIAEASCGITIPPENPTALANAILELYSTPINIQRHMGASARKYVEKHHDIDQLSNRLADLLDYVSDKKYNDTNPKRTKGNNKHTPFKIVINAAIGIFLLLCFLPVILGISILNAFFLGFPIFFIQERIGQDEKSFKLFKFRTMKKIYDKNGKLLDDNRRLTKYGGFLRKYSLDELPTLINVIKSDMNLVGPRPLLPEYLSYYTAEQKLRHTVKPGITGWAQCNGRNAISWKERLTMDVWYVKNKSLYLDFKILCRTFIKVLKTEGIVHNGHPTMPRFDEQESCEHQ